MKKSEPDHPILRQASDIVLRQPIKALELCEKYLSKNPVGRQCSRIQYSAYDRLGNWKAARQSATEMIEHSENPRMGFFDRARAHYRLGDYAEAISDAQNAIAADDNGVLGSFAYRMLALAYAAIGETAKGVEAVQAIPSHAGDWYPPVSPIPAGTKLQFTAMIERMANQVREEQAK